MNTAKNAMLGAGTRALIIGLGRSGRACLDVLEQRGATLFAADESQGVLTAVQAEFAGRRITMLDAASLKQQLPGIDVALLSPGVPPSSPLVQAVLAADVPVISEIEAAYRISPAPVIAITGTKGKTTTTALTGALLQACGRETFVGGNIGNALIAETAQASERSWVVAEISSFQLETISEFRPKVSTIINISPDHLDRYPSMDEYIAAKFRIFMNQGDGDIFIGNLDDPVVARLAGDRAHFLKCEARWFSYSRRPGSSVFVEDGYIVRRTSGENVEQIMPVSEIPLLGRHNVANVVAAISLCLAVGCDIAPLRAGVQNFRALSHRLEPVATHGGVRYIDDSKATNPGSVAAALSAVEAPVVLIAGGKKKGTDFHEMGAAINAHARAVVLIGEAADDIAATIKNVSVRRAESMAAAVDAASELAQPGDVVLLSPGCASFDMFRSAEARGDEFAAAVKSRAGAIR